MNLTQLTGPAIHFIRSNSSLISSVAAGIGTVATAYVTARASFTAARVIRQDEQYNERSYTSERDQFWQRTKLVWKYFVPPALLGGSTLLFIAAGNRFASNKILALQGLVALKDKSFSEYRDKVVQEFSARKDQSIVDKVVADKVANNPPPSALIAGPGKVLCCEELTMRYFESDVETLRKAMNDLNALLLKQDYVTLEDWYWRIGLQNTKMGPYVGWTSDRLMELIFTAALTEDGRPCMAFDYNYTKPV